MKKVLIIEDDPIIASVYRGKFQVEGFLVEVAADGQTGLDLIFKNQPDAVLLDLMLPRLSGVEILKKVRANPAFQQLPIIVFSNAYLGSMVEEAWKAGATQVLAKATHTPRQIIDIIRSAAIASQPAAAAPPPAPQMQQAPQVIMVTMPPSPAPAPQPSGFQKPSRPNDSDDEFQGGILRSFIEHAPETVGTIRKLLQEFTKSEGETTRLGKLFEMYRKVHSVTGNAGMAGMTNIAQLCSALEALLKELYEKPKNINPSSLRTVAQGVDTLAELFQHTANPDSADAKQPRILVVDDDAISRRAIAFALEKANLHAIALEDPLAALKMLEENFFDVIFLDVEMPGMNGFSLCARIRTMLGHEKTPVIFVTSLSDFQSRARSTLSGGTDLIGKPFLFVELSVKALLYVLRSRL